MGHLSVILSIYIVSLAIAPVIKLAYSFSSEPCIKSCSRESVPVKDADGCQKETCSPFSCCLKTLALIEPYYNNSNVFTIVYGKKDNFNSLEVFIPVMSFDIWHPPRSN